MFCLISTLILCVKGELSCRMFTLALLCALVAVSVTGATPHLPLLSSEMVNFINKANTTWTVSGP